MNKIRVGENDKVIFYKDEATDLITQWAIRPDLHGNTLRNYRGYIAEFKNNHDKFYVLLDGNKIVYESQSLEEIGTHIDMMKIAKRYS